FDLVTGEAPVSVSMPGLLALVAAAGLARIAIIFGGTITGTRWRVVARSLVQRNLLTRILRLPGARAVPDGVGGTISTVRDDAHAISMMGDWVYDTLAAIVFMGGGIAILMAVDLRVTLIVVPPI